MFEAIEIEINSNCNKACSYCPNSKYERIENGFISEELFQTIINQLMDIDFKGRVSYSFYNEPTLNKNLESYVEKTKKYLPKTFIELYTNGSLLNKDKIECLVFLGVDKFTITKHEDVEDNRLEEVLDSLNPEIKARINYKNFSDIKLTNRGGSLPHLGMHDETTFLPCKIPQKIMSITLQGNVLPCFEDYFQKNIMGNILNQHIRDIWKSEKYLDFRMDLKKGLRHKHEICKSCSRLEVL